MRTNCSDVINIIKYILFNEGCTIAEIAAGLDFSSAYVIKILKSVYDDPLINITLCYSEEYKDRCVFEDISKRECVNKVRWKVESDKLDAIPAGILTEEQRLILTAVIECSSIQVNDEDYSSILDKATPSPNSTVVVFDIPKKTVENNGNMNILQRAVQERHYIKASLLNTTDNYLLKPHGFIRNDLNGEWFLIAQDENDNSKVLLVSSLNSIKIMPKTFTRDVPVNREWALKILSDDMVEVKVEFDCYEAVLKKVRSELTNKGALVEVGNDKILFKGVISDIENFKTFIMRLGSSARVLSPKFLRDEIINETQKLIDILERIDS
ncbi:WYL domain-containing protein [Herbivorax sp. ANBcel31]|uniref:WYL domain-containing protein n=1 Tax=Herbivorax sp. ANBcel31 TaxID=3069754 RepID=UPI0027B65AE5|nr:WYL domain-containing protein [Herbivorax sp. ANBcel31]MDQ2087416.1 WYL domain-containing protein [Herbivorax sp. ANBcel31]